MIAKGVRSRSRSVNEQVSPLPALPAQCLPDQYLTKETLEAIFHEFNAGLARSLPTGTVFNNLISTVRNAYISPLLYQQQMLLNTQSEYHELRLSQITERYERQILEAAREREAASAALVATPIETTLASALPMPVNASTFYVCSAGNPRREMVGRSLLDQADWSPKFEFKAFTSPENGTIKVTIIENKQTTHRVSANLDSHPFSGPWTELLHFYAFQSYRQGTEMISVGAKTSEGIYRCFFIKGEHADMFGGLDEKFVFWVPV